jgi:hypothetical protein
MILRLPLLALLTIASVLAQENQPALTPLEKAFQDSMSNVTLAGRFSRQGGTNLSDDKYVIDKVTKLKDDLWQVDAVVPFRGQNLKIPISVHIKWAGDTPVIELTDELVPSMGKYTVRLVIYRGQYAGMWSAGEGRGGQMFGTITKTAP